MNPISIFAGHDDVSTGGVLNTAPDTGAFVLAASGGLNEGGDAPHCAA